jgi:serine/threonine protein kinase
MQIRCSACTKTLALAADGALPALCPHCRQPPGPGPLGSYDLLRLVATGGMGEVWQARHRELGTEVAIKLLPAMPLEQLAGLRERFAREARLTARVDHPGVVKVHEFGEAGDRPFLVLELVAGRTLRARLQDGEVPVAEAARIAAAIADVLAEAHACGVLHRDIKPDNVMLEPGGTVRVLDFGIARAMQDEAPLTRTGELVGTPEYMAPEQLLDGPEATTERTDVHALGVLLHELLTGRSPFHGGSVFQALKLVESLVPPPPSRERPEVPRGLDDLLAAALAKDPAERIASANAFAVALRQAVPAKAPESTPGRSAGKGPLWLAAAALAVAAGIALLLANRAPAGGQPAVAPSDNRPTLDEVAQLVRNDEWHRALAIVDTASGPADARRALARQAFDALHVTFIRATNAPDWLLYCDESRRQRWFGHPAEPLSLPAQPTIAVPFGIDGLTAFAQRVPFDAAEHWLAELGAAHLRDDAVAGTRAAEMAWLSGGGEFAVVLDAYLHVAPLPGTNAWRTLAPPTLERLRRRLAAGEAEVAPACPLLLAVLDALHGLPVDPEPLRLLPSLPKQASAHWCLLVADLDPSRRETLLGLARLLDPERKHGR